MQKWPPYGNIITAAALFSGSKFKRIFLLDQGKKKTKRISKLTVTVKDTIHLKESHKTKSFEENQYSILRNRQGKFDCLKSTVQA